MIRANLLPRPKERIAFGGFEIDSEYLRQAIFGALVVVVVFAIGMGIESLRLHRLEDLATEQEARLTESAPRRAQIKALALEVARYQNFAREAEAYRRSGTEVATVVARIGNGVPEDVWIDSLEHQPDGFSVNGGALRLDVIGKTIVSLGRAMPAMHATLVRIDNRPSDGNGVRFSARMAEVPVAVTASAVP